MAKFKLIADWKSKNLRCHFCDSTKSVKYETEVFDPVIDDAKPTKVCICNRCVLRYTDRQKQIDEFAQKIKKAVENNIRWSEVDGEAISLNQRGVAKELYNDGYRKQSEIIQKMQERLHEEICDMPSLASADETELLRLIDLVAKELLKAKE